ncbi:MAG: DPP IV N-terminal domain-containing protein [Candidatus Poribacteria bacterium]|nr:DPP IV N-terminal domain-containing protein [Candidatus Poribacteria bacterium]
MKRHLTYIMFETILLLAYFSLAVNLYVHASDAPYIAFSSNRDWNYDIYMMDIKGKNLQNLTNSPTHEFQPTFSPDGHRMAYVSSRHDGYLEIYVMNLSTKVSHRLTHHPKHDANPAWSPDGRWIAFDSNRQGKYDIYKIEPDGENLQRLTHEGQDNYNAAWSPDSKFIAFGSFRGAGKSGIYIMDAEGRNPRCLENQPRSGNTPAWSPDGKQIAFSDMVLGNRDILLMPDRNIYTVNVDGSDLRQRTRHPADDLAPVWSLDGKSIVYFSVWNQKSDIYLIEGGFGRHGGQLTRHPANDEDPTWVPTGFFPVSPTAETQTTLWGRLKQSAHD